jgi:hypothetical protein
MNGIGTLRENSLHASLKKWCAEPEDGIEVIVDGYHIDIVRSGELIEIQTANFAAIKNKLRKLLPDHQMRLVYPIAKERWIIRTDIQGQQLKRRKSPKRGRLEDLFDELIRIPGLISHPNLNIEALLIQDEVVWQDDGRGSWRRKGWSVADRRLISVLESVQLYWPDSYREWVPAQLADGFTNRDLAQELNLKARQAQKMTYCLSRMDVISCIGHRDRFKLYTLNA